MFNTSGSKSEKKDRVLSKGDLEGLSPEEQEFAEEQFRLIYACTPMPMQNKCRNSQQK